MFIKINRENSIVLLIILSHLAGIFGILWKPSSAFFLFLIPFHLLFMLVLGIFSWDKKDRLFWGYLIGLYFLGFFIEFLGVKTGKIFGIYTYGPSLGWQFFGIPLVIGINWILLSFSSWTLVQEIPSIKSSPFWIKSILGGILMTLLDLIIEPVAIHFQFWNWAGGKIPLQNYLAWFIFSFFIQWVLNKKFSYRKNIAFLVLYISQVIFFLALNLSIT